MRNPPVLAGEESLLSEEPEHRIDDAEVEALAQRLGLALQRRVDHQTRRDRISSIQEDGIDPMPEVPLGTAEDWLRETPPEQLTWGVLAGLVTSRPELFAEVWAELRTTAGAELRSGGRVVETLAEDTPLERARILALRDAFAEEWRPRGGLEQSIIDQAVVAYDGLMEWQERANRLAMETDRDENSVIRLKRALEYETREGGDADIRREHRDDLHRYVALREREAEAVRMVQRYQQVFLRALRMLRDTRKLVASVHIHNEGQLNIGKKQINVDQAP
ncbi:MAG: hypothetical protein AAF170_00710 [Bacteroidota bacterium]